MKILLTTLNSKFIHTNLAIRILYHLYKNDFDIQMLEFTIKDDFDYIANTCKNYDLVAFSCYIWNIEPTLQIAKKIKNLSPNTFVLLAGPEVSYENQNIISLPFVDFIIEGEGEIAFGQLLKNFENFENVSSLVWKKNGEIIRNKSTLLNLNYLKNINPYQGESYEVLKNKVTYIEATRGCPFNCSFCLAANEKVRYLPKETFFENLYYLCKNAKLVKFLDRTFNANVDYAIEIIEFILKHRTNDTVFQFEIKADFYQKKFLDFIKKLPEGVFRFEIGIQSVNNFANEAVGRRANFENIKTFVHEIGNKVELHTDLIVGLPFDDFDAIKKSFNEVFYLYGKEFQFGFLKFLKGSRIKQQAHIYNYIYSQIPPYEIISSKFLSNEEIAYFHKIEKVLNIYWNRQKAFFTFIYLSKIFEPLDFIDKISMFLDTLSYKKQLDLLDYFEILSNFADSYLPKDKILKQIIAVDYFLCYKIKPKIMFINEIDYKQKLSLLISHGFNYQKFRYVVFEVNLDLQDLFVNKRIQNTASLVIIEYKDQQKPQLWQFFRDSNFLKKIKI